jgi:hypothetical protein
VVLVRILMSKSEFEDKVLLINIMNIKKPIAKKVAVAFPDAAMKPVPMPRPATNVKPINMDFKGLFRRLRKTTK